MTIADVKPGGWAAFERLLSSSMNLIKAELAKAVDGTGGGNYSPSAKISIQGSNGLEIAGTGSAARLRYSSRAITRVYPLIAVPGAYDDTRFTYQNGFYFVQTSVSGAGLVQSFLPKLPNGGTLDTIALNLKGAGTHSPGTLATKPTLKVYYRPKQSFPSTQLGSTATDPYVNAATYEAWHQISVSSIAHTIDTTSNMYFVEATGEASTLSVTGLTLGSVEVTCTIDNQSEW